MKYIELDKIKGADWKEISKELWYKRLEGYYINLNLFEIGTLYQTAFAYYKMIE